MKFRDKMLDFHGIFLDFLTGRNRDAWCDEIWRNGTDRKATKRYCWNFRDLNSRAEGILKTISRYKDI